VSVRAQGEGDKGVMTADQFAALVKEMVAAEVEGVDIKE
jgi:hypothetical protein